MESSNCKHEIWKKTYQEVAKNCRVAVIRTSWCFFLLSLPRGASTRSSSTARPRPPPGLDRILHRKTMNNRHGAGEDRRNSGISISDQTRLWKWRGSQKNVHSRVFIRGNEPNPGISWWSFCARYITHKPFHLNRPPSYLEYRCSFLARRAGIDSHFYHICYKTDVPCHCIFWDQLTES